MIVPALAGGWAEITRSREPSIVNSFRPCPPAERPHEVQASHGAQPPARAGAPGSEWCEGTSWSPQLRRLLPRREPFELEGFLLLGRRLLLFGKEAVPEGLEADRNVRLVGKSFAQLKIANPVLPAPYPKFDYSARSYF